MVRQKSSPFFTQAHVVRFTSLILVSVLCLASSASAAVPTQNEIWDQVSEALASPAPLFQQARITGAPKPLPAEVRKQIASAVSFLPEGVKRNPAPIATRTATTTATVTTTQNNKMIWPTEGLIYSTFNGSRGSRRHGAIDICTSKGTPIRAAQDGIVSVVANGGKLFRGYGKIVILDHGKGLWTLYSHCDTTLVKLGQRVKQGEYIATVGNTGRTTTYHLHFEVRVAGVKKDPLSYLPSRPEMVKSTNYRSRSSKKAN